MSTATQPPNIIESFGGFVPYRMPIEQYEAMVNSGVFTKEDRFELIEGLLVKKMTHKPPHATSSDLCENILHQLLMGTGWYARDDKPIRIPSRASEPEPDVAVARGTIRDYEQRHPNAEDVALVVEVSDSSLEKDRLLAATYGAAGIPFYLIINIPDRQLEVFSSPVDGVYTVHQILLEPESVELVIEGRILGRIGVAELLPRP